MLKFPYGISDFAKIITGGYWYVDRTDHLRLIEDAGEQLLLTLRIPSKKMCIF